MTRTSADFKLSIGCGAETSVLVLFLPGMAFSLLPITDCIVHTNTLVHVDEAQQQYSSLQIGRINNNFSNDYMQKRALLRH